MSNSGEQAPITKSYRRRRLHEIISILSRYDLAHGITPEKLFNVIEALGPTYIKLGQILAMRQDILPPDYCKALLKLQEHVSPLPFNEILSVLEDEYHENPSHFYSYIDPVPLGSASIAQVHRATLRSDGSSVVLKVQRPGIYPMMAEDVALLKRAAKIADVVTKISDVIDFNMVIDEMWATAQKEMDFLIEAKNAETFYLQNEDIKYITSPIIYDHLTTSKVLVMNYIGGFDLTDKQAIAEEGYDLNEIAVKLCSNYIHQILDDGFFQADPHHGNIKIFDNKIAWIDMGMMGRISNRDRRLLGQALEAVATGNIESLKSAFLMLGQVKGRVDHTELYIQISDMLETYSSMELADIDLAVFLEQIMNICSSNHIAMPQGITMLVRGIVTLEGVILDIAPSVSPIQIFIDYIANQKVEDFDLRSSGQHLLRQLLASGISATEIPVSASEALNTLLKGQMKVNIALTGSEEPLSAISRMVNKIVMCIILAALIIGSSFIATTSMDPKILGIPALGVIGYGLSAVIGFMIVIETYKQQKKLDGR